MKKLTIAREAQLPTQIELGGISASDFNTYYQENKSVIETMLLAAGAVKFTGVQISSAEVFQDIVYSISDKFLDYIDGTTPRTKLSGNVYTSTEYIATEKIAIHNELSYSARWPGKLYLSCLVPAATGGETLLADSREMLARLNPDLVAEVETKGIIYIRNLHGGSGVGTSWQSAFETNDKSKLEAYCKSLNIQLEWGEDDAVRLYQPRKGVIAHATTGEKVWFNQIDHFHPCQLGEDVYEAMMSLYESPEEFPTYVKFGDGTPISEDLVNEIVATSSKITVAPPWQKNEFLVVDNILAGHGRNPYTGERKVVVAMTE